MLYSDWCPHRPTHPEATTSTFTVLPSQQTHASNVATHPSRSERPRHDMQTQSVLGVHYRLERLLRVFVRRHPPPDALEHRAPAAAVSRVS